MKAKKETTLVKILTGSRLYGTSTEKSDFDYKAICLPTMETLLLNIKVTNRKEKPEGSKASDKMLAGETETEYLPLQVFFDDFFNGQTYALEIAFAIAQGLHVCEDASKWQNMRCMMQELIDKFLTNNVKKMVGYAVSQSKLYGLKTERYSSLSETLSTLNDFGRAKISTNEQRESLTFVDLPELVKSLTKLKYVKMCKISNGDGGTTLVDALDICGKQYPLTNKIFTVVKSLEKTICNYGERVKEFEGEGVDWKAFSHAIRITEQVLELSSTGKLVFPRSNANLLRTIKNGEMPLGEATAYLQDVFSKVDTAISTSVLQERTSELEDTFKEWKINKLSKLYHNELKSLAYIADD